MRSHTSTALASAFLMALATSVPRAGVAQGAVQRSPNPANTYGSISDLAGSYPNEWELFARSTPFSQDGDAPRRTTPRPDALAGSGSSTMQMNEPGRRAPDTVVVTIRKFMFDTITVNAGDVVVWRNSDQAAHTLTADSGAFESPLIEPGQRWSFRFTAPGTYAYHCIPHPFMKADVRVRKVTP